MRRYLHLRRLACLVMLLSLCAGLGGCACAPLEGLFMDGEKRFDVLMDDLFRSAVSADSITLNYYAADPSHYGIQAQAPTYGEWTDESIRQGIQSDQKLLSQLKRFHYDQLRADQQAIYDILMQNLNLSAVLDGKEDCAYYISQIHPTTGLQAQLPVLLAEYHFYTAADIDTYLQLLEDTGRYFGQLIDFERERSNRGFFLSDANADKVIQQCESFLQTPEQNLLILVFNDRMDQYEGLSDEQRAQYKQKNQMLVTGNVLPAYEALLDALRELRGKGAHEGGLAALPDGKAFAKAYLQLKTGSSKTPEQADKLLSEQMDRAMERMSALLTQNPKLKDDYLNGTLGKITSDTPENYLAKLQKAVEEDLPAIKPPSYALREVHMSLQEHMSPAFYLPPALDRLDNNIIYINPKDATDNLTMFTTLAHEGYPGHLYQTVYFLQQSPHPIRTILSSTGYTEGWGTYAEMQGYYYAGLDDDAAALMQYSRLYDLLFISRIDLGVNALGWDMQQVASLCSQLGIDDADTVGEIYQTVIGEPLAYLPYSLGCLEIVALGEEASDALGEDFNIQEFHRFFLSFGPAPFELIRTHMKGWMEQQQKPLAA